jgi:predicted SnoaL-like aldol condensation-catalyzing enzyme
MPNSVTLSGLAAALLTLACTAAASGPTPAMAAGGDAPGPTSTAAAAATVDADADKALVLAFYEAAFGRLDPNVVRTYFGYHFIQHDPAIEDGVNGFARYHQKLIADYPKYSYEIRRAVSSGGLVTVHVLQRLHPWDRGDVQIHMYRVANGALAEHWAVGNPIPATSLNANGLI